MNRTLAHLLIGLGLVTFACSDDDAEFVEPATAPTTALSDPSPATTPPEPPDQFAVGTSVMTLVDSSRPTPRSGDAPARDGRTLVTSIWYPAIGEPGEPVADAPPDNEHGPYPLIVFSHGLGATPGFYADVLNAWAQAGFVVVAPVFPLSNQNAPAGPDAGDVANQPGDVSFLIAELTAATDGPIAGLLDADRIGVAGHSNGGITTVGLLANSCCRDDRIDAGIVLAGTPSPFDGVYDFSSAPPTLFVHGDADAQVNYLESVRMAGQMTAPRGVLTILGADHSSWVLAAHPAFGSVMAGTLAFWRVTLLDDQTAVDDLTGSAVDGLTTVHFTRDPDAELSVPTTAAPQTNRQATISVNDGLVDGQTVTVSWSGFIPGGTVNVVQCANGGTQGAAFCDLTVGKILQPDETGSGSLELEIIVGPVGTATCGVGSTDCVVVINDSGLQDADATIRFPITFASG